jgi:hypothetical protein
VFGKGLFLLVHHVASVFMALDLVYREVSGSTPYRRAPPTFFVGG